MIELKKNQNGFTAVEALLIMLILVVIGAVGYIVYHNDYKTKKAIVSTTAAKVTTTTSAKSSPTVTWQTYSNQQGGFTYQYPSNWVNSVTNQPEYYGSFSGVEGTITAPDGNKLAWIFQSIGGGGGGSNNCASTPGSHIAFAVGNYCASQQVISTQQLPALNPTTNQYAQQLFNGGLYITNTKYDPGIHPLQPLYPGMPTYPANSISYQICLDSSYTFTEPTAGTSVGTMLFPCEYWDTGFEAIFPLKNGYDFNTSDAQTAVKIMKSFNTLP